nr:Transcription termination factor [Raoultella ornithinolytica]
MLFKMGENSSKPRRSKLQNVPFHRFFLSCALSTRMTPKWIRKRKRTNFNLEVTLSATCAAFNSLSRSFDRHNFISHFVYAAKITILR